MALFAVNTNFNGTVNLFVRDNVPLYMAYLLSTTEVGYLNLALKLIVPMTMILDPFIWPTYAEITRTVAERQWQATLRLLRRVSAVTASIVLALGGGLALIGWWLIPALYGRDAFPAYPTLLILLVGYGMANVLQWNRPLLLALGRPSFPLLAAALAGVLELVLIFTLVRPYGYLMMAAILSGYFILSTGMVVLRGLAIIRQQQALPPE
jgi:O-antigen/teichoic acid export membrane protein